MDSNTIQAQENGLDAKKGDNISKFPKFGWKASLDHVFPEKRNQNIRPRMKQLPELLPMIFRYLFWYIYTKAKGRRPFIDCLAVKHGKQIYGVPLGGIGSGTIGRGFKGEFCRYQMIPGIYEYNTVMANQFIVTIRDSSGNLLYQKVLSPYQKCKKGLESWDWGFDGADGLYCGLYPRSWTVYNIQEQGLRLICRQISPVIPHNYKDSCLPVGVFVWTIENNNAEIRKVSITLTFKNGTGGPNDKKGDCWSESFSEEGPSSIKGVTLHQTLLDMPLRYSLGVKTTSSTSGSFCVGFNPHGSGEKIWKDLKETGHLQSNDTQMPKNGSEEERAVAICGECSVGPMMSGTVEISLAWDMPNITFKGKEKVHKRRYTRWFNDPETAAQQMVAYALNSYTDWEQKIAEWQSPVLDDPKLPDWFKSALFNELYFISDGGSIWIDIPPEFSSQLLQTDPRIEFGRFAYLESQEYRMYNTYDVHFYASWALIMLWPRLQETLQYDIAMYTSSADLSLRTYLYKGEKGARKIANSVPHDIGDPEDEPFVRINAYQIHNIGCWKDLNLKFVLQVFRDFTFLKDKSYLVHMWPVCRAVMDRSFSHDQDSDGLIENDGQADQTYDTWTMHGPSAYCCSLWVASLAAMTELASVLGDKTEEIKFQESLAKAKDALYQKLWNGKYFKFDSCRHQHSDSIMSDQLVGHWYLSLSQASVQAFSKESVRSVLKLLFDFNVMQFNNGEMGAVNGMNPDGSVDRYTMQSEEMWVGVSYSLAATMIYEGMLKEGFKTAEGVYRTVYEKIGLGYETPEALYQKKKYRAIGYMRPLSIWSMYHAYHLHEKKKQDQ